VLVVLLLCLLLCLLSSSCFVVLVFFVVFIVVCCLVCCLLFLLLLVLCLFVCLFVCFLFVCLFYLFVLQVKILRLFIFEMDKLHCGILLFGVVISLLGTIVEIKLFTIVSSNVRKRSKLTNNK